MTFESKTIITGPVSTVLLCTVLASAHPKPAFRFGVKPVITISTTQPESISYAADPKAENWIKFRHLALQWKRERGAQSTVFGMAALPSYMKIIGMGKDALPLILEQLKSEANTPDHWFWALAAISDENPVPPESRGKLPEMAKAWLAWGQKEGYVD